ncbi:MAG TPA: phosphopantothenoylcysteine decarboxylase [Paludibacteraceae bacterium]|nr:phosphopantothenoylcysteine decarboxylase [Paludibacteraceae bacterium]
MINIAITAGGTSENMDGVRKITNISTGQLGWHCLEAILDYMLQSDTEDFHVHYLLTETAARKTLNENQQKFVSFIEVTDAESVFKAVDKLTKETKIDFFIHSMAVSDFTFSYAANIYRLAEEIEALQCERGFTNDDVRFLLENPQTQHRKDEKISSDNELIIGLKPTKKVIPLIKQNNPATFLVGFKLLRNATEEKLMAAAEKLTAQNGCDMVFANEVSLIGEKNHEGILIKGNKIIDRPRGKKQIAKSIVNNMLCH